MLAPKELGAGWDAPARVRGPPQLTPRPLAAGTYQLTTLKKRRTALPWIISPWELQQELILAPRGTATGHLFCCAEDGKA